MNKKTEELKRYLKLYIGLFMCALGCIMILSYEFEKELENI